MSSPLTMALLDIATHTLHGLNNSRGPSYWNEIKDDPSQYGNKYDYYITRMGRYTAINPCSNAALQYLYFVLPEGLDRWGATGFKLDSKEALLVQARMTQNNLVSLEEYEYSMAAEDRDVHAGESQ